MMTCQTRTSPCGIILLIAIAHTLLAPIALAQTRREINFPDILGYKTLKCDLHTHTVFSDGYVWPVTRVREAWREGLDVLAITDHIEYKPHEDDVNPAHNRPFEIAEPWAQGMDILLPKGAEVTRDTPPGHYNGIFMGDIDPVDTDEFVDAIRNANEQGAFVFWNHPSWQGLELGNWREIHDILYKNQWLHGIEVVNQGQYYPEAHRWCLEKNLTMLGNSDYHRPSMLRASTPGEHRTMTLVFVKERTLESLKEALFARRTVVWHENQLIGRQEFLEAIFKASVEVGTARHWKEGDPLVQIRNHADVDIKLKRSGEEGPATINLGANATSLIRIETDSTEGELTLNYTVENFLVAPGKGLDVQIIIPLR